MAHSGTSSLVGTYVLRSELPPKQNKFMQSSSKVLDLSVGGEWLGVGAKVEETNVLPGSGHDWGSVLKQNFIL